MSALYRSILGSAYESKPERRKCFVSYHHADQAAVDNFVKAFSNVFIPKAIGVSVNDDYIDSDNPDYVMSRIRRDILGDSTVTLCLIGQCTHSRRYVDWELKASLRQGDYVPNGLVGILLPHMGNSGHLPQRIKDNWSNNGSSCYATYYAYPGSESQLRGWIEDAFSRRESHAKYISNSQGMMRYNGKCLVHDETH